MATLKSIIEELHFLSDRISTQVRTVAICLIIVAWGFLLGTSKGNLSATEDFSRNVLIVGTFALLAMVCDFLQYLFGYLYTNALREEVEKKDPQEGKYVYSDFRYKLRTFFFWTKQIILGVGVIWFLIIVIPYLFSAD